MRIAFNESSEEQRHSTGTTSALASEPVVVDLLMMDTIVLCGNTMDIQGSNSLLSLLFARKLDPKGPPPEYRELADQQWEWVERELKQSK